MESSMAIGHMTCGAPAEAEAGLEALDDLESF